MIANPNSTEACLIKSPARRTALQRLRRDTRGANLVEYIMLVGLIAVLTLAVFQKFGGLVKAKVKAQTQTLEKIDTSSSE